jgi:hypothetical protein
MPKKNKAKPLQKTGPGNRATFISPYLRRPLRPLNKVLNEREDRDADAGPRQAASEAVSDPAPSPWRRNRKSAVVSD